MIRKIVFVCAVFAILSWSFPVKGKWQMRITTVNGDTLFLRDNPSYSIREILQRNKALIMTAKDSMDFIAKAREDFAFSSNSYFLFRNDSDFLSTQVRSENGISQIETDTGIFRISGDTLIVTRHNRIKKTLFFIDAQKQSLYFKESAAGLNAYVEFIKVKD